MVATTPQVADFVRDIGGGVRVIQIIKPGVDPHEYEPTPADMQGIGSAKLVVKNGAGLEKWLDPTISAAGYRGPVVDASRGVPVHGDDPHIWHDPRNAKIMVADIEQGLAAADPSRAAAYARNLAGHQAKPDKDNETAYGKLPAAQRKLVTNHDAVLAGALGGRVGAQVVLRRLSFLTMALTHATFPGVVAAAILGLDIYLGGAVAGIVVAAAPAPSTWRCCSPSRRSSSPWSPRSAPSWLSPCWSPRPRRPGCGPAGAPR